MKTPKERDEDAALRDAAAAVAAASNGAARRDAARALRRLADRIARPEHSRAEDHRDAIAMGTIAWARALQSPLAPDALRLLWEVVSDAYGLGVVADVPPDAADVARLSRASKWSDRRAYVALRLGVFDDAPVLRPTDKQIDAAAEALRKGAPKPA